MDTSKQDQDVLGQTQNQDVLPGPVDLGDLDLSLDVTSFAGGIEGATEGDIDVPQAPTWTWGICWQPTKWCWTQSCGSRNCY